MNFLHYQFDLDYGDIVKVTLDSQANVQLLDDLNFYNYKQGQGYRYIGGLVKVSPFTLVAPHAGHWNVVIDLGGYGGTVHASVSVIRNI